MGHCYPIQGKPNDRVGRADVDSFEAVVTREDRRASTQAYIDTMRPSCVELARVPRTCSGVYDGPI